MFPDLRFIRYAALAGLVAVCALVFFGPCRRKPPLTQAIPVPKASVLTLAPNDKEEIVVDTAKREVKYAIRMPDGTVQQKVVEGVRRSTITEAKDGTVTVIARRWGFCLEPGLGVAIDQGPRPALDFRFFYFDRFGILAGLYYRDTVQPYAAIGYELSRFRLFNTSIWVGGNQKEVTFGARLGF